MRLSELFSNTMMRMLYLLGENRSRKSREESANRSRNTQNMRGNRVCRASFFLSFPSKSSERNFCFSASLSWKDRYDPSPRHSLWKLRNFQVMTAKNKLPAFHTFVQKTDWPMVITKYSNKAEEWAKNTNRLLLSSSFPSWPPGSYNKIEGREEQEEE